MRTSYSPKNNPRVIIIQKLYGSLFNDDEVIDFPKHRFKKFIKDVVNGTIERDEFLDDEINRVLGILWLKEFHFEWSRKHHRRITKDPETIENMTLGKEPPGIIIGYWNAEELSENNLRPPPHLRT